MRVVIKHLSFGVEEPKQAAQALAELTDGKVASFHPVKGAYVCMWPDWSGQFVELYPKGVALVPTDEGADFHSIDAVRYCSTHLNLDTDLTGEDVKAIAGRYGYRHYFRPKHGGPLHEVMARRRVPR